MALWSKASDRCTESHGFDSHRDSDCFVVVVVVIFFAPRPSFLFVTFHVFTNRQ